MVVFNYTKVRKRDKRIYSLFNTPVSKSGISTKVIYTSLVVGAFLNIFGILICIITKTIWYNPIHFTEGTTVGYFYMVFIFGPMAIGIALNTLKIQNYKLVDYLLIYFSPKIPLNQNGKRLRLKGYKMDTFVEKL